jgi:hypothetical protein
MSADAVTIRQPYKRFFFTGLLVVPGKLPEESADDRRFEPGAPESASGSAPGSLTILGFS